VAAAIIGGFFTVVIWPTVRAVLGSLWDKIESRISGKDFEHRYLDWVIREHRYMPILPTTLVPVTDRRAPELDKLYVSLSVAEGVEKSRDIGLADALRGRPSLVILGDPGAGKTTMLRFLALTFARARRGRSISPTREARKKDRLSISEAKRRVRDEYGYQNCPIPIFVYMNRLRDVATWPTGRSLLDVLRDEWKSIDGLRDFPQGFFEERLRRGECIFLFDAFDELGTQKARDEIARRIGDLVSAASAGNRFVVTSRIVGYAGQLSQYGFHVVTVQKLSWELIVELVRKWYDALEKRQLAEQLLGTLRAKPQILELAVNPMLLSLIALVQYVRRLIPDQRHILYDECVKVLVERRYAPPEVQEEYNQMLPGDEAIRLLRELALTMHSRNLREAPRSQLEGGFIPEAVGKMPTSRAAGVLPSDLLKNIEQRSQLLVERGFDDYGQPVVAFSHLTFQEYLASVALKESTGQKGEALVSSEVIRNYQTNPEWWEEVALLYAAQLDGPLQQAFFRRLYPELAPRTR
jgi:predicted NACHT family NTPase